MKHIITSKNNPGLAGFKYNKGDLVEFTDRFGSKHVMAVMRHMPCSECCMHRDGIPTDNEMAKLCTLDSGASLCHNGWNSKGVSKFVGFKYVDDILENL